jgi:hypothetical protein
MGSHSHGQAVRRPRDGPTEAQRGAQRLSLLVGQHCQVACHRMQQRVQAGEAQSALCLDPGRPQDPHRPGLASGVSDQRRFPDTRLAAQYQYPAVSGRSLSDQLIDPLLLRLAPREHVRPPTP